MILRNARVISMLILHVWCSTLYISGRDHARKLKFSIYVNLPSIIKMFQYRYAWVILWGVGDVIIFEHPCYISALEHIRMLWLSLSVNQIMIYHIYYYRQAWMILRTVRDVSVLILWCSISSLGIMLGS